jgi:glycosyltransferase involved in cell wall biosynthesis
MGLDHLIGAVAALRERVPEVLVLIAGRGPLAHELTLQIQRARLDAHCRLVGFIADDQLPAAYRAADLSVVPSVALEGYGLIVPESLAAGTPVMVTPVGGLPEAVEGLSRRLVLDDATVEALARGLGDALAGTLPLPDAAACQAHARAHNDWPVVVEQIRRVYESVRR